MLGRKKVPPSLGKQSAGERVVGAVPSAFFRRLVHFTVVHV